LTMGAGKSRIPLGEQKAKERRIASAALQIQPGVP